MTRRLQSQLLHRPRDVLNSRCKHVLLFGGNIRGSGVPFEHDLVEGARQSTYNRELVAVSYQVFEYPGEASK